MSVKPYEELCSEYQSHIQDMRNTCYTVCLKKVQAMDVPNLNHKQIGPTAYKVGQLAYEEFAKKVRNTYANCEHSNLIELLIGSEKPFFTGCGPYYLPQQIINVWESSNKAKHP